MARNNSIDALNQDDWPELPSLEAIKRIGRQTRWRHDAERVEREWHQQVGTPFPGWSRNAVDAVAAMAGLEIRDTNGLSRIEIYRRVMDIFADRPAPSGRRKPKDKTAVYLGNGTVQVDGKLIHLIDSQADVIETLVERRAASLDELRRSGASNPSAVLKTVCDKQPLLAPFIKMPGRKGQGGYSTAIIDGRNKQG